MTSHEPKGIEAENSAFLYYDAIADFHEGELKKFFSDLAQQEESHATELRKLKASL